MNSFKPKEQGFRLYIRKRFFVRVVRPRHKLPRGAGAVPSLEVARDSLDGAWSSLVQLWLELNDL